MSTAALETFSYKTKSEAGLSRERKQTVIDRELDKILKVKKIVTSELILEVAAKETHPLHKYFEWDNTKAAAFYREGQALAMIMSSKIIAVLQQQDRGPAKVISAAHSVRRLIPAFRGEGFRMRNEVLDEKDTRAAFIQRKKETLRSWCRSTVDIPELKEVRESIEAMLA